MALENANALLYHMLMKKKQGLAGSGFGPGPIPGPFSVGDLLMAESRIYVGLNDAETKEQKFETETCLDMLKDVCRRHHVAFSVDVETGGYYHEDGEYTEEKTLVLMMIDVEQERVKEISEELCSLFHQESVLVTEDRVRGYFVKGKELSENGTL